MTDMSPDGFRAYVQNHVADYFSTDGATGAVFNGLPCVVLTTIGAKSGELRHSPIIAVPVPNSPDYLAVASMGGSPKHPSWYFNIVERPTQVTLQDGTTRLPYEAKLASGEERSELWNIAAGVYPLYDEYQTKTSREIPVFRLSPIAGEPLAQTQ